jgi:hypothetical protein
VGKIAGQRGESNGVVTLVSAPIGHGARGIAKRVPARDIPVHTLSTPFARARASPGTKLALVAVESVECLATNQQTTATVYLRLTVVREGAQHVKPVSALPVACQCLLILSAKRLRADHAQGLDDLACGDYATGA